MRTVIDNLNPIFQCHNWPVLLVRWLNVKFHRYIYMPDKSVKFGMLLDKLIYLKKNPCSREFVYYLTIETSKIQNGRHWLEDYWFCDN